MTEARAPSAIDICRVLVTGSTGYVGGRLVPRLLNAGHDVRVTITTPDSMQPWWSDQVHTVQMDIGNPDEVRAACAGMDAVYYLIHGMGGDDFREQDRAAAQNMAAAVDAEGVDRIVYLSGIVPDVPRDELSEHIISRLEVEEELSKSSATTVALRAAIVMGSASTSFEIVRQISERLPIQTVPDWMNSDVQPIALVDVVEALLGALSVKTSTRHYDVGGNETLQYPELLRRYATIAQITRPQAEIPLIPDDLVGILAGAFTDVPSATVRALVQSLHHDMVASDADFVKALLPTGYELLGIDEMIRRALADVDDTVAPEDRDPMAAMPQDPAWAGGGDDASTAVRVANAVKSMLPGS